jgi:hypothetical protein
MTSLDASPRLLLLLLGALAFTACDDGEEESDAEDGCEVDTSYQPTIVPADFVSGVDHPLFPLVPGTTSTYEGGGETVVVSVTSNTRLLMGVTCIEVRDTVTVGGVVTEDTLDWFAQDVAGNVWYFGEDTKEYEEGKVVSTAGSWAAGVGGAQPGIVMLADPKVADVYRQEYLACQAEDAAEVVALGESVSVPYGDFNVCLRTRDYTPLDPMTNEYKWYCPGVGQVAEVDLWTGKRVALVSVTSP